ncbi:MAG: DUF177 domain-containing protein [Lachnospiraceae bacterium]|nr:DUF177 domain-containing protein [Lachnospiraceae bacterium]
MLVNLSDVFVNEGCVQEMSVPYEADVFTSGIGTFEIKEKSPVALKLSNIGHSKVLVEGSVKLTFLLACDRCLADVDHTFDLSFRSEVVSPDYAGADAEDYDSDFMEQYHLDADKLINNEILLNWPVKILCRQDCKGICKVCGKNLNDGECGCDDFVPDPRMAMFKDIFEANKEV